MKTRLLFAGLVASTVLVGCSNEELLDSVTGGVAQKNDFALISNGIGGADTRMVYDNGSFLWEAGIDEIGLSRVADDGKNVNTNTKFTAERVTDDNTQDVENWAENGSGKYAYFTTTDNSIFGANYVVYYPYNPKFAEEGQGKVNATLAAAQVEDADKPSAHVAKDGFMMSTATHFNAGQTAETFVLYPVFSRIAVTVKAPGISGAELQTVVLRSVDGSKIFPTKATIDADITANGESLDTNGVKGDPESMVSEIVLTVDGGDSNKADITDNDGYTATMTVIPGQYKNIEFYIVTNKGAYTSKAFSNAPMVAGGRTELTYTITDAELSTDRVYYASSADSWNYAIEKIGSMTNNEFGPATIKVLNDIEVTSFRPSKQPLTNVPVTVEGEGKITITENTNGSYWPNITFNVPVDYGTLDAAYIANDNITFNEGVTAKKLDLNVKANVTIKGGKIGEATVNNNDAVLTVEDATFTDAVTVSNTAGINANGTTNVTFTDCTFNKGISVNNDNKGTGVNAVTINGGSIEKASSKDAASTLTIGGGTARNNTVIIKGEVTADAVNVDQAYTDFKSTLDIQGDLTTNALEKAMTGHIDVNKDASLTLGEDAEYTLADALLRVEGTLTNNGTITVDGGKLVDIDQNNGNTGLFVNNGVLMVAANKVWYENQYITLRMENGDYVYTGIMSEKDFADALAVEGAKPTGLQVTAASFSFANDAFEDNKDFSNVDVIFSNSNAVEVTVPDGLKLGNVTIQAPVTIKAQGEEEAAIATGDLTVVKSGSLALSEDKVTVICVNLDVQKDATATQGGQISYTGTNKSQGTITGTPIQK